MPSISSTSDSAGCTVTVPAKGDGSRSVGRLTVNTLSRSKPLKYNLFDVFDVPPHSCLCRFSVTALNRSQNPPVAGD